MTTNELLAAAQLLADKTLGTEVGVLAAEVREEVAALVRAQADVRASVTSLLAVAGVVAAVAGIAPDRRDVAVEIGERALYSVA